MDHQQAVATQMPERYVFGELPAGERDLFEEHLADCSRCLEDVRVAQSFAANTQAVFREQAQASAVPAKPRRFAWWPSSGIFAFSGGLNLALAGVALYAFIALVPSLQSRIRGLETPAVSESFVAQGVSRGATAVFVVKSGSVATVRLDLPSHFERYLCGMESVTDGSRKTYNLVVPANSETLNLTIPSAGLAPGDYKVRLSGSQGTESELLAEFVLRVSGGK